jgi:GNAT superfamily N-acetyltransferase
MQIIRVEPAQFKGLRRRLLRFVNTYKDRHITPDTYEKLRKMQSDELNEPGNIVVIAVEGRSLLGILAAKAYGRVFSLAVVNRRERSKGVGKLLLREAIACLGDFHVEIASDNIPSLKLAFRCKLTAHDVFMRNGKPILRLKLSQQDRVRARDLMAAGNLDD